MIIDTHLHPTNLVDEAWRHTGTPFNGERMLKLMDGPYRINGKPRRIDMGFIMPPPGNTVHRIGGRTGREGIRDYMAERNPAALTLAIVFLVGGLVLVLYGRKAFDKLKELP